MFAGLLKCADCGWGLRYLHNYPTATRKEKRHYFCTTYSEYGKEKCSIHHIRYDILYAVVLGRLQYWIAEAHQKNDSELLQRLLKSEDKQRNAEVSHTKKELAKAEKRLTELDNLFVKIYEDRAKEAITERNFAMLSAKYQEEQVQLEAKKQELQDRLDKSAQDTDGAEKWLNLVRKYTELTELNAPLLNELIDKIVVHEKERDESGEITQEVEIFYRFVGKID